MSTTTTPELLAPASVELRPHASRAPEPRAARGEALRVALALAAVYGIWSTTYLALRVLVVALPPLLSLGLRQLVAGAVLFAVGLTRREPLPSRGAWLRAAPVGALLFVGGNALVAIAERSVSSSVAAVAFASTPLWAAALGALGGERVRRADAAGMALGLASVLLLCGASLRGASWGPAALLFASPVCWALGSVLARRSALPGGALGAALPMLTAGALMLPLSALAGERPPARVPLEAALAWGYLTVFGSVVAFSAFNYLLRRTRPAVALSYSYVNPLLAVLLGATLAGEGLPASTAAAGALVLGALLLLRRAEPRVERRERVV